MRILVIDDEPHIRDSLRSALERHDNEVLLAAGGEEGLDIASQQSPDLIILDLAMPGLDGFEVCRQLRRWTTIPIVVLSVRDSEDDKIRALDLGADDYLTKPFGVRELFARMRAVLRRTSTKGQEGESIFSCDDLFIDFTSRTVLVAGEKIRPTPKEYDLLRYLVLNANRVLTHRQLLIEVWGEDHASDTQTLRVHIANLRTKIELHPARPRFIHTESGVGYRFYSDYEPVNGRSPT
jgi:two-component system KDP operon response regulator KdpE